jgi:integrase
MSPLKKRKGSQNWIAYTKIKGKTFNRSTGTPDRQEAQRYHDGLFKRLVQLLRQSPENSLELTCAIVREVDRVEREVSTREAQRVGGALSNFARWAGRDVTLDQVTTETLNDYQYYRKKQTIGPRQRPISQRTIRLEINYVLRLLRLNGFPVDRPRPVRAVCTPNRSFSPAELERFFAECPSEWRTLFLTLYATGARPAELVPSRFSSHTPLLQDEVDAEDGFIILRSAKRHPSAPVPIRRTPVVRELCLRILDQAPSDSDFAFRAPGIGLNHLFDRILEKAGIPKLNALGQKLTAHSFRHTFATIFHQHVQGDLSLLRRAMGHTQISTTMIYDHYTGEGAPVIDIAPYLEELA